MELSEQQLQTIIDRALSQALPHDCFHCVHFKFNKSYRNEAGKLRGGYRVCQCPEDIYKGTTTNGVCSNWVLEPREERRVKRFV